MKKYKRTRIVASLAVISSLAWSSTTFGATVSPLSLGERVKHPTYVSTHRSTRTGNAPSTVAFDRRSYRTQRSIETGGSRSTTFSRFMGTISSITPSGFSLEARLPYHLASSSTPVIYSVSTSDTTTYMKDGKLDASIVPTLGQHVVVTGSVDTTTNQLIAKGVDTRTIAPRRK